MSDPNPTTATASRHPEVLSAIAEMRAVDMEFAIDSPGDRLAANLRDAIEEAMAKDPSLNGLTAAITILANLTGRFVAQTPDKGIQNTLEFNLVNHFARTTRAAMVAQNSANPFTTLRLGPN